ncbi:MAG TPA: CHRD domain-containing protein, partial [Thermoanaerobaculia bacterium]|nr:CHRD domain-containing protein [Thermoanaerobaculia bacterium]
MTRYLLTFCCVALLAVSAAAQSYVAVLTGDQEVPNAGDPDGIGTALVTIDGNTIRYSIVTQNLDTINNAHIHPGARGVAGGVLIGFNINTLENGVIENVPQGTIDRIRSDPATLYVNVHTVPFPAGAIRGQLVPFGATAAGVQYVPVVGKVTGAAGTNFVTDVRIINRGSTTATVDLDYFQQSTAGMANPTASASVTVEPGEQAVLDDIIGVLNSSGLGALRVRSSADVDVLARVLNDLRDTGEGTTGFAINGAGLGDGGLSGTLGFLAGSSTDDINAGIGFRTNIGYFNPTGNEVTATFTARSTADGSVLGSRTITIPAGSFVQQGAFELINTVPAAHQVLPNFYVT